MCYVFLLRAVLGMLFLLLEELLGCFCGLRSVRVSCVRLVFFSVWLVVFFPIWYLLHWSWISFRLEVNLISWSNAFSL